LRKKFHEEGKAPGNERWLGGKENRNHVGKPWARSLRPKGVHDKETTTKKRSKQAETMTEKISEVLGEKSPLAPMDTVKTFFSRCRI